MYPQHSMFYPRQLLIAFPILWLSTVIACASPGLAGSPEPPDREQQVAASDARGAANAAHAVRRVAPAASSAAGRSVTVFESGQVRPLAMSPDRRHLFAVNTPDDRLEVFRI